MMIVDLIDGDDFRDRLVALGIRIPEGASPETCARMALLKHAEVGVPGLQELVQALGEQTDIMLPSVRAALERFLLPALR
ncbi:hypothetical protein [Halomonas kalidii]|uniref:Uncharacterized protein n=1 Tax=Halomonas kalidii TaxID=3043293 RepID=A0ABT6VHX4_9GAMM|nr:hypothetical protein [Halomonas kalidii]MDI5933586.1 hypothetical protein [Halomonas kalidii]